jgi:hypothetical protein
MEVEGVIRFFSGLTIGIYFFTKIDILIWQRIFEANKLWDLGIGTYHQGWTYALFGFMALGVVFFYPNVRRMVTFPLSLTILAFSGLEDILYYWLDGRAIPAALPWLNTNPLIIQPVSSHNLLLSASIWLCAVVCLEIAGAFLDRKSRRQIAPDDRGHTAIWAKILANLPGKRRLRRRQALDG